MKRKDIHFPRATDESAYYGVSGATVRLWRKRARENNDPVNTCNPTEFVAWYRRNYQKREVTQSILEAVARFESQPPERAKRAAKAPSAVNLAEASPEDQSPERKLSNTEASLEAMDAGGMMDAVDRARRVEALFGAQLEAALQANDKAEVDRCRMPHLKAMQALREVETAAVNIARKRGDLIERNAVVAAWTNLHSHMPRALTKCLIAAGGNGIPEDEWIKAVHAGVQSAFELLPDILPEILSGGEQPEIQ